MTISRSLEYLLVLTYLVLFIIWLIIAWEVWSTVRRSQVRLRFEQTSRRLLTAGLLVSLALAVDCGYWLFETAGRWKILIGQPQRFLENPLTNIIEKSFLILAAAAFLWTFKVISGLAFDQIHGKYFSRFAEWAPDAITLLDCDGRIQYWNKRAEQMFGWDRDQVIGRDVRDVMVPPDRKAEVDNILESVRNEKKAFSLSRAERHTRDRTIIVSIDTAPILDPDFVGYFSIIRPASERNLFANHPYFRESQLPAIVRDKVFVAMPFSFHKGGLTVWDQIMEPLAADLNLHLVRADRQLATHGVVDQLFRDIASAELVVADLTGNNPNVYYEVGLAHALGVETLLLLLVNDPIPFNVSHRQIIYCDPANLPKSLIEVRSRIVETRGH